MKELAFENNQPLNNWNVSALPPRFTVDPSSLPSVGDVSDDDDGGEVAVFAKTDFDTLE